MTNASLWRQQGKSYPIVLFLFFWTIINIFQGHFTELADDEAYYWAFSQDLNFGYFDHPPMVAWIMSLGQDWIPGELGLRIVGILLSSLTLWTLWKLYQNLSKTAHAGLFILVVSSVSIFHLYGFITTPDTPLLFFGAWFLMAFKAYLKKNRFVHGVELVLVCTALMYSKYHGGILLLFAFASQPQLFKRLSFWVIAIFSVILYLPHLSWQVANDFATFQYHFFDRSPTPYQIQFTSTYLLNQMVIAGPLIFVPLVYGLFQPKESHTMNRTLWVILIGFFVFFFGMSFKGHVEPHWNALALFPLILLGLQGLDKRELSWRWVYGLGLTSIVLFGLVRVAALNTFISKNLGINTEFHNNADWAQELASFSLGKPVVFLNSYQRASKLRYYAPGIESASIATTFGRKSQYDLWNATMKFEGREVLFADSRPMIENAAERTITGKKYYFLHVENYHPVGQLQVNVTSHEQTGEDSLFLNLSVTNHNERAYSIQPERSRLQLYFTYEQGRTKELIGPIRTLPAISLRPKQSMKFECTIPLPKAKGSYRLTISTQNGEIPPNLNGSRFEVNVP